MEYNRLFLILVLYKTLAVGRTARLDSEEDVAVLSTKSGAPLLYECWDAHPCLACP